MTVPRAIFILAMFAAVAISVVTLRSEQIRVASRILDLQRQRVELRQTSWSLELEISRLRAPQQIGDRVGLWSLNLYEPGTPAEPADTVQLAMAR